MIGMGATWKSAEELAFYLEHGDDGMQTGRILWSRGLNGMPDSPMEAAPIMNTLAERGREMEQPIYHLAVSCGPAENATSADLKAIMRRTLDDIGLGSFPAVILEHQDKSHRHGHAMVCLRHYEGNTWSTSNDHYRIEKSLREQEVERGWTPVRGRLFWFDAETCARLGLDTERPCYDETLSTGAFRYVQRVQNEADGTQLTFGQLPFVEQARDDLKYTLSDGNLDHVQNWAQLLRELKGSGYQLREVSRGFVLTNGEQSVAASHVSRHASKRQLEQRYGSLGIYLEQIRETPELAARAAVPEPEPASGAVPRTEGAQLGSGDGTQADVRSRDPVRNKDESGSAMGAAAPPPEPSAVAAPVPEDPQLAASASEPASISTVDALAVDAPPGTDPALPETPTSPGSAPAASAGERYRVINESVLNADVRDQTTGEKYMARSTAQAYELTEWANQSWRVLGTAEVHLRLGAMDQSVRDVSGFAERPDAEQLRAYLARWESEMAAPAGPQAAMAPAASPPQDDPCSASTAEVPVDVEPVPVVHVPEPDPEEIEEVLGARENHSAQAMLDRSIALGTDIAQLEDQAKMAMKFLWELTAVWPARTDLERARYRSVQTRVLEQYGTRFRPDASHEEMIAVITSLRDEAVGRMRAVQTQLHEHDLPQLQREIEEQFRSLSPDQRRRFLRAYPQYAPLVNRTPARSPGGRSR